MKGNLKQDKMRIRHCIKRIAHLLGLLKEEMDDLCDALNITKDEEDD
jgi:hypothetical protein